MLLNYVIILGVLALGVYLATKFSKSSSTGSISAEYPGEVQTHKGIEVQIVEYVDADFPGWVRCTFTDAYGKQWFIREKAPVVGVDYLDTPPKEPAIGFVAAEIKKTFVDEQNRELATIDTDNPWMIRAENDQTEFDVLKEQIVER